MTGGPARTAMVTGEVYAEDKKAEEEEEEADDADDTEEEDDPELEPVLSAGSVGGMTTKGVKEMFIEGRLLARG